MSLALPVIRGTSAALYPFTMTVTFRTIVGRWQSGSEQRSIANPGALIEFSLPYAQLTQAQKDTVEAAITAAQGQFAANITLTLGATTYTNLSLDSDDFAALTTNPTRWSGPLKVSQPITQNLSPGTPGLAFPTLANGAIGIMPYTQGEFFQTVVQKTPSGTKYVTPEFGGGFSGYPTGALRRWIFDEHMLTDADAATRLAHFIANWGKAYAFDYTDEYGTLYGPGSGRGSTHYSSDSLTFVYNGVNDTDVRIELEITND